ncbi:MAG: lipid II:glycine glycyltransferase FemX [Anaerolineae bacterium]
MKFTLTQSLPESEWRRFVDEHPQGNIFHTPEMFQVFAQAAGHRPSLWAALDSRGRVLALLLPVQITLMGRPSSRLTSRAVVYGSVLCVPSAKGREALVMLLQAYQRSVKGRYLFTELRNLSDLGNLQPVLNESGFTYEQHLNFLIDLDQPEETIWRNISKSGRQSVRTSRNKGVIIEEATDRQQVAIAYQLLQKVYTQVQVPLASPTLFEAAFDILVPRGMFKILLARVDEHHIGTCVLLMHNERIIDWYASSDRAFSSYCPSESLIWHTLQWGKEHGFHLFDFGGAGKPDEEYGVRDFKAKFGGQLVCYGRNICIHAPALLHLSRWGYEIYKRFL